jgi:hypothetical protein
MTGVVGNDGRMWMPSFFSISAMASMVRMLPPEYGSNVWSFRFEVTASGPGLQLQIKLQLISPMPVRPERSPFMLRLPRSSYAQHERRSRRPNGRHARRKGQVSSLALLHQRPVTRSPVIDHAVRARRSSPVCTTRR